jgi:hypothetical protein
MQALDADGDGIISKNEIANAVAALKKLDKNNDGMLSREEQGRSRSPGQSSGRAGGQASGRPGQGGGRAGGQTSGRPGQGGGGGDLIARVMESDKNKDGKISKDEAPDRMKQGFDRIDANGDGFIDRKELEALAARIGGGNRGSGNRGSRNRGSGDRGSRNRGSGNSQD